MVMKLPAPSNVHVPSAVIMVRLGFVPEAVGEPLVAVMYTCVALAQL